MGGLYECRKVNYDMRGNLYMGNDCPLKEELIIREGIIIIILIILPPWTIFKRLNSEFLQATRALTTITT